MSEALRKSPNLSSENQSSQKGLKKYSLNVKKHMIVLDLLLNNIPSTTMFKDEPLLFQYKKLVKLVSNGKK